jgi:hypothetical protein
MLYVSVDATIQEHEICYCPQAPLQAMRVPKPPPAAADPWLGPGPSRRPITTTSWVLEGRPS